MLPEFFGEPIHILLEIARLKRGLEIIFWKGFLLFMSAICIFILLYVLDISKSVNSSV